MQRLVTCIVFLVLPVLILAQNPRLSFEVASIKPNTSGRCCTSMLGLPDGSLQRV